MAYYAALVSLVQLLDDIINHDRYPNIFLHKQQIASVYESFSLLQTSLDGYSLKDRETGDFLERRIRDAAYRAQDIIESHISDQIHQYLSKENQKPQQLQDLEEVKEEVNSIFEELRRIMKSHTTQGNLQLNYYFADAGTSDQASGTNTMVGFEEHLTTIKDQLCGEPSKLQVVSIVGMGGIGKTTLARNIFDDELIVYKFDCRAWVTVSQDYHLQKVLLDISNSLNVPSDKSTAEWELGEKMYKYLKGKRYLIIMDDVWDTKVWDDVKRILPNDTNGSRIMITTRISDVASDANRFGFPHQLQFLNEDQSWDLFRQKVFCPPELEDIGRLIAKNCGGLPLAIVVVAGLLCKVNKAQCDWEEIARNLWLAAAESDRHFSKILSLSYNHLPHYLKPLFLYIGGFPEDHEIPVSKLIKLWVAEGILKPIESKSVEAVGEEYLEDLVNRNLVLITKKRSNGTIKCCGIHDVLRDLCIEIISYENFLHVVHPDSYFHPTAARNARRLFVYCYFQSQSQFTEAEEFGSHVRSIISDTRSWESLFASHVHSIIGFKLLRVLDATEGCLFKFPAKILELFHLRYLALNVIEIPPSISQLQNLETLIIKFESWVVELCSLPSQIREMPNLRHIMSGCDIRLECPFFNEKIGGKPAILENLQTLSLVVNVKFINEVIEMIPNLQKLKVLYYDNEAIWQKFRLDNLFYFHQLETLNIEFLDTWRCEVNPLPESFSLPLTLKKLSLRYCKIPWKDMTVVGSLPNLQVLKLRRDAFVGEKWEPVEGEFPQLKFLLMEDLKLLYWKAEYTHFPVLQHLKISDCLKLQEIPLEIGEISTLELVEVSFSELAIISALKMLEEQRDMGNDLLQVRVHPPYWNSRLKSTSKDEEDMQEEASESGEEIQEEASECNDEIKEEML